MAIETIIEYFMGLVGLSSVFVVLYIFYKAIQLKNKERMLLIEKGMDPSLADAKRPKPANPVNKLKNLKDGLLGIGIALGFFAGYLINRFWVMPEIASYLAGVFIFGGGALVLYYFILIKQNTPDQKSDELV